MSRIDMDSYFRESEEEQQAQMNAGLSWTVFLGRRIGYGFLLLSLADMIQALVPPDLMNPAWEFQTIGLFAERAAIPLLALLMVFAGRETRRSSWEGNLLKLLSWLALLLGILHLLMLPLGILNTVRLDRQNQQEFRVNLQQRLAEIEQLQGAVNRAKTSAELQPFLRELGIENPAPALGAAKEQLAEQIAEGGERLKAQAKELAAKQQFQLFKNSLKWNLGVLLAGSLFLTIWQFTRTWTRFSFIDSRIRY